MIAQGRYVELDKLFSRSIRQSLSIAVLGSVGVVCGVIVLQRWFPQYSIRLLPLFPMALLAAHRVANVAITGIAAYLRAHKKEPLMGVSVVNAVAVGLTTWFFGRTFGPTGAAVGLLATTTLWTLPSCFIIFRRCCATWHKF
jgi:O-antigen/teichoic acid export membrane protein